MSPPQRKSGGVFYRGYFRALFQPHRRRISCPFMTSETNWTLVFAVFELIAYFKDLAQTSSLLNANCKKALNLLKKGLLIQGEAKTTSKRRVSRRTTDCSSRGSDFDIPVCFFEYCFASNKIQIFDLIVKNTMAEQNVPAQPSARTDEQITGKTSGSDKPRHPVLQMQWGIVHSKLNVDHAQESVLQEEGDDPDLELAKKMSLDAHQEKGEGEGVDADIERAIKLNLDPAFLPQGRAPVGENDQSRSTPHDSTTGPSSQPEDDTSEKVIHESSSTSDSERTESETEAAAPKGDKEQGEVHSSTVTSGVSIPVSTQSQTRSDPEKAHEALAGPDPKPMQEDQTGSDSKKVHVSLAVHQT
ncbi:hypothetical protein Tco_0449572 [Tanacetum coccineum]